MAECKKWVVTYTKHKTQKRKVYQDGTLELWTSSGKLALLDDGGGTLESRLVKRGELVESGGTAEFVGYLVDIGELEGNCRPVSDSASEGINEPVSKKTEKLIVKTEGNGIGTKCVGLQKFRPKFTSPSSVASWKAELHKAPTEKLHLSTADASRKDCAEWDVLYTTQITQKAKRYHDGVLKILCCGSLQKQAMLYDEEGKLLNSQFLKGIDVIDSGRTLAFDTHIIKIENIRNTSKHSAPINGSTKEEVNNKIVDVGAPNSCRSTSQKETNFPGQLTGTTQQDTVIEWHCLYTTQKVQKAAKYHDGILKITSCGILRHQATLLSEDESVLGTKYFLLSENVSCGRTFEMANYLIDIGEPKASNEGYSCCMNEEIKMNTLENFTRKNNSISDGCKVKTMGCLSSNKLLRNATQILSVLRRPETNDSVYEKELAVYKRPSEHLNDQLPKSGCKHSERSMEMDLKDMPFSSPFEQVFSSNNTTSEGALSATETHLCLTRLNTAEASNEELDAKVAEKHHTEMTQFSQQMQNAKDYNSSYSRIEEIECALLQNASDCKDYRPCEKLQVKSSLGEFVDSGKQSLMESLPTAGAHTQERTTNSEEENYGLGSSNEKNLIVDDIPTFDLGF